MPQMLNGGITVVVALEATLSATAPPVVLGAIWVGCTPREACTGVASMAFGSFNEEARSIAAVAFTANGVRWWAIGVAAVLNVVRGLNRPLCAAREGSPSAASPQSRSNPSRLEATCGPPSVGPRTRDSH
jgi:hypothetical protein